MLWNGDMKFQHCTGMEVCRGGDGGKHLYFFLCRKTSKAKLFHGKKRKYDTVQPMKIAHICLLLLKLED